ncbi:hypothetical protein P3T36_004750 [Kitasatospora sp. MAP12-15]|nr:hypothetical protein [Kitasatospora sp. MAP12-44]
MTFRPTSEDAANLAIRYALALAAREQRQADLRADAARLMSTPEYLTEVRTVRVEVDELSAW